MKGKRYMMKIEKIKAIIVDDEVGAQNVLERLLQRVGDIEVVGKADNVSDGLKKVILHGPDIIFLDVQMPEKNGFELVSELQKLQIKSTIIFVTAHLEFAVDAFKIEAFDYLLKPITLQDLEAAILRFRVKKIKKEPTNPCNKISFNTRTGYIYICPEDIVYCQADVNYTELFFDKERKEVITINIGKIEEMLPSNKFFRISRSFLINVDYLIKADRKTKTCELVKNNEAYKIPVPRNQIKILEDLIASGRFNN